MEEMSNEERLEEETPLQTIEEDTKGGEETAEAIVPDLGDQETELNEVAAEELPQTPDPVEDVDEEDVHEDIVDEILVIPTDTDAEMEAEAEIDPVQLDSPDTPDESLGESEGELIDTAAISAPEPVFGFDVEQTDGEFIPLAEDSLSEESETEQTEEELAKIDDDRQWYVVHCYSGYENKVRHNLEQRIETMGMKNKIFDVVVPTEEEMEVRDGKRRTVERRVFPGYILVQMLMNEDSWYVVRNTPGVTGFVGMGNDPTPLRPEEVSQIIRRMEAEAPRIKVTYAIGQKVRIIDGPFNDFIGTVDNIDVERAKVRVMVSFFGRETPVELDFLQVEKA